MEKIVVTKKGLYIKELENFGGIVFSPFSGLFFAISDNYIKDAIAYCNNKKNYNLPDIIIDHFNIGITDSSVFDVQHWLPQKDTFSKVKEFPPTPIVINWLLSSKCNFDCKYCYAGDVIDKSFVSVDVKEIANKILSLNPLSIVLSGGEPLLEKKKIIDVLSEIGGKVGIMLDTNGYIYDQELTNLFKKYNVVIRVSLDTLLSSDNIKIRPTINKAQNDSSLAKIIENIYKYKEQGIPVFIHTVVTPINKNSLDDLFLALPRLNINGWRIFSVVNPNDERLQKPFEEVMKYGHSKSVEDAYKDIAGKISIFKKKHPSKSNFSVQIVLSSNSEKNSVILVLPDGRFVTESPLNNTKDTIDLDSIFRQVNIWGHYKRYLGTNK